MFSLDGFTCCNHINMDPLDAEEIVVSTPMDNFHNTVMSFSFMNVSATYQCAIITICYMIAWRIMLMTTL